MSRKTLPETFCMPRRRSIRERIPLAASGRAFRLPWGRVTPHRAPWEALGRRRVGRATLRTTFQINGLRPCPWAFSGSIGICSPALLNTPPTRPDNSFLN